jgi:ATP-dependent DNA ligase
MSQARRKYNVDTSNFIYRVWDVIPAKEFLNEVSTIKLTERKKILKSIFYGGDTPLFDSIRILPDRYIHSEEEMLLGFEYWHDNNKEEGTILKKPDSFYPYCFDNKRSKDWIKFKIQDYQEYQGIENKRATYSVEITGAYLGDIGTKNEFILGGFTYIGKGVKEGKEVEIAGNCGGGYKDSERVDFWENQQSYIGKIMDVESQEITTNKKGTYSLRFPIFKGIRFDLTKIDHEQGE